MKGIDSWGILAESAALNEQMRGFPAKGTGIPCARTACSALPRKGAALKEWNLKSPLIEMAMARLPRVAYIIHWFPNPSETFIFHEVTKLREMGLPLRVFTLYGRLTANVSFHMSCAGPVERLGIPFLRGIPEVLLYWSGRAPDLFRRLCRHVPWKRWSDLENAGENLWAFLCGFRMAQLFERDGIEHIHAAWANGPATAAWVASRLTGIPFSLAAHATDIYPPDGALEDKIRECTFVRSENWANVDHLIRHAGDNAYKIHMIYSGHPMRSAPRAAVAMAPPYRILGLGRFVPKKGFDFLIRSCKILQERGLEFQLVLGGDGRCRRALSKLASRLGLDEKVLLPGFVPYGRVSDFLQTGDLFVMPSVVDSTGDRDGLPNVILEALLHRLPVVATDVCGIREVILDGKTGLLVPQKDPHALANAIVEMIGNRSRALEMAENGRSLVLKAFDLDESCRRMVELLKEHAQ